MNFKKSAAKLKFDDVKITTVANSFLEDTSYPIASQEKQTKVTSFSKSVTHLNNLKINNLSISPQAILHLEKETNNELWMPQGQKGSKFGKFSGLLLQEKNMTTLINAISIQDKDLA
ncbi:hypothetical protein HK096_002424, partial [Nowakowskiella sp. JEL0078]